MSRCCKTINLARDSVEQLKQIECCLQKVPSMKFEQEQPPPRRLFPPSPCKPSPVSKQKIILCTPKQVMYECPPVPCVCPPCPECRSYLLRLLDTLKFAVKVYIFYRIILWTNEKNIWEGHQGTAKFMLEFLEANFPTETGGPSLPDMGKLKYKVLSTWDKVVGTVFYYTVGVPLKAVAGVSKVICEEEGAGQGKNEDTS